MPTRFVTGVLDDGVELAKGVPADPRKTLRLIQGATLFVKMVAVRNSGQLVDFADDPSATAQLTVRKHAIVAAFPVASVLQKAGVFMAVEGPGRVDFNIIPDDTKLLEPGRYVYDVWLVLNGERIPLIPVSPFIIEPAVLTP